MKMSIEESIDRLEDLHFEQDNWEYGELTEDCLLNREALRLAIDTMRKYQKIIEILDDWKSDGGAFEMSESYWLNQIREVVEDGNVD